MKPHQTAWEKAVGKKITKITSGDIDDLVISLEGGQEIRIRAIGRVRVLSKKIEVYGILDCGVVQLVQKEG